MNEKAYKAMGLAGAAGIAVGIVVSRNRSRCDLYYQRCPFTEREKRNTFLIPKRYGRL